jgi:acyl carrier protein
MKSHPAAAGNPMSVALEIAAIIRSVLEIESVSQDDDFFEIGGDSLAAVRVMTRVRRRYNIQMPLSSLFRHPTAEALAAHIVTKRAES